MFDKIQHNINKSMGNKVEVLRCKDFSGYPGIKYLFVLHNLEYIAVACDTKEVADKLLEFLEISSTIKKISMQDIENYIEINEKIGSCYLN